ncbi:MAG: 3-oxoadipate enol-lactonase [Pseudomonadota bacterium]
MQATTTNGLVLHFEDVGPGDTPALVFSNSIGTEFRIWRELVTLLPDELRVICYDKRGHGLSECPTGPYAMNDHMRDLAGLLDRLEVKQATIIGLSVGGMIAQSLAVARPDLVRGLVLCDTAHKIGTPEMWETRIQTIRQRGIGVLSEPILERWFSASYRNERPEELAVWRAMLTRTPVEGYIGTCAAIRDANLTESSRALDLPTVCVVGSEDGATPPALVRSAADLIGAGFVEIEGPGHLPCIESPGALAEIIGRFLRENGIV